MCLEEKQVSKAKIDSLIEWFSRFNSCLVAFSAGVDSSVLAYSSRKALGNRAIAVTSLSASFAESEISFAKKVAHEIGIELMSVSQDDLADDNYIENQVSRCYYCRRNLVSSISQIAKARKIEVCVDGTHVDDMRSPRPGIKALREAGFRAPFVELNFSKEDVRDIARLAGLSNAERPSEACLSSRIAYGQRIDFTTLRMIEKAERVVRELTNAKLVRVRTIGKRAVVELDRPSIAGALEKSLEIVAALKFIGYLEVEIDPNGYTQGRMLSLLAQGIQ